MGTSPLPMVRTDKQTEKEPEFLVAHFPQKYLSSSSLPQKSSISEEPGHESASPAGLKFTGVTGANVLSVEKSPPVIKTVFEKSTGERSEYKVLNQWEGVVVSSSSDGEKFTAIVRDQTTPSFPEEEAEFDIEDVPPGDRPLLRPGAIFRWFIAREMTSFGQIKHVSFLRFRRLPLWTKGTLETVKRETDSIETLLLE